MVNTFKKEERLINRKDIEALLKTGTVYFSYPLRILWTLSEPSEKKNKVPAKVAFAVPKKKFKRAVKRNILKRKMRESYRLNKHILYKSLSEKRKESHLLIVYIGNELISFHDIEKKIIGFIKHLVGEIQKNTE